MKSQEYQDYERVCRHSQQGKIQNPDLYCFYYHGAKPDTQFTYGLGLYEPLGTTWIFVSLTTNRKPFRRSLTMDQ